MKTIKDVRIALGLDEVVRYENFESFCQDYNKHYNRNLRWKKNLILQGCLNIAPSEVLAVLGEPIKNKVGAQRLEYLFQINRNFINIYYDDRDFRNSTKPQLFYVLGHDNSAMPLIRDHLVDLGLVFAWSEWLVFR